MNLKKYKTELLHDHCYLLVHKIEALLVMQQHKTPLQAMHFAALAEVMVHLKHKLVSYQKRYKCTFSTVHAIAIQQFIINDILNTVEQYNDFDAAMLGISNNICQTYIL